MKRRSFLTNLAVGSLGVSACTTVGKPSAEQSSCCAGEKNWKLLGTGDLKTPVRTDSIATDVLVVGGGMTGVCAAVAAAREGSKVILVQDRPVLGGNASSEIRVNINGVTHLRNGRPERETGLIEEVLLLNRFANKTDSYYVFDDIVYDFVMREPNMTLLLNTQAIDAKTKNGKIEEVTCWQTNSQTKITISANVFIDCSGDGEMAARAGALYRTGREASSEFGEKYAPKEADGWQLGCSLMFISKDTGAPVKYVPPSYAIKYNEDNVHKKRKIKQFKSGYWWIEVGSDRDIIGTQEEIRQKLKGYLYGVWDFIKNSGKFPEAENYALDWVGSVPGRRESRRFEGDYWLKEGDLIGHKHFKDAIGFGGWSLDEHNPGGIEDTSEPPSYFHENFAEIYEIPYGSLYSKNISNLLFAGRNISQTHIALSSTRVIATCCTMGQAVGTAAAMCHKYGITPRDVRKTRIDELQEILLRNDSFIPMRKASDDKDLARLAILSASSTKSGDPKNLVNGVARDIYGEINHWESIDSKPTLTLEWADEKEISKVEIKCDTNCNTVISPRWLRESSSRYINHVPVEMLKDLKVEALIDGNWKEVAKIEDNQTRLIKTSFAPVKTKSIRLRLGDTYGKKSLRLYEVRCYQA